MLTSLNYVIPQAVRAMKIFSSNRSTEKKIVKFSAALLLVASSLFGAQSFAVSINTATLEALQSVKGIGASKARAIVTEREKNGTYKDAEDLSRRVKGIGSKTVSKMEESGLTFDGKAKRKVDGKSDSKSDSKSRSRSASENSSGSTVDSEEPVQGVNRS